MYMYSASAYVHVHVQYMFLYNMYMFCVHVLRLALIYSRTESKQCLVCTSDHLHHHLLIVTSHTSLQPRLTWQAVIASTLDVQRQQIKAELGVILGVLSEQVVGDLKRVPQIDTLHCVVDDTSKYRIHARYLSGVVVGGTGVDRARVVHRLKTKFATFLEIQPHGVSFVIF